jgi:hypothetical protein
LTGRGQDGLSRNLSTRLARLAPALQLGGRNGPGTGHGESE